MTCPDCHGRGRIPKRFLLFFTRRARCPTCLGTGEFPPPRGARPARAVTRWRDDDDRRDTWASRSDGATSGEAPARDAGFEVGSGGRSGGGGASASWGDASDNAPIIVDPFAGDSSSTSGAAAADASESDSGSDSSSSDSGSSDSGSSDSGSSDSGTSY